MTTTQLFLIVFFGIIAAAILCTYLLIHGPRIVKHVHEYKPSKDYDRLYDLVIRQKRSIIRINSSRFISGVEMIRLSGDGRKIWGFGDDFDISKKTKEQFIHLCEYLDIEYLDQIDFD